MDAVSIAILLYLAVGVTTGLVLLVASIVQLWKTGEDLLVKHLLEFIPGLLLCFGFWPFAWGVLILEGVKKYLSFNKDTVVLRGSRSAKTHKALMED